VIVTDGSRLTGIVTSRVRIFLRNLAWVPSWSTVMGRTTRQRCWSSPFASADLTARAPPV
jgi:hypothetical protein